MNTLPRDEPNAMPAVMTKKINCTKVTVKCVNKAERKLYEKEIYLPGTYPTIDEELEIIRKKYSSDEDVVLTVVNEEKGVASVAMDVDEFIKLARLVTKKGNEK